MIIALIILIVALVFTARLAASGMSSRRVALVCLAVSVVLFGGASAIGAIDIGPHVECPGWFLGALLATTLMISCGLCLAGRRLVRR